MISVIIPIYNVEKYIRKCLDSLVGQSLKQIEIICIDDGSKDGSGDIADTYVSDSWPKIRVIHQENKGLSAARNRGIDESRADWLMFVDSDDWVEPGFCEIPLKAAIENQADMVIFQTHVVNERGVIKRQHNKRIPLGYVNHETVIEIGWFAAWRKLYRKELFNEIRYPEGYVYEDIAVSHRLVYKTKAIVSINSKLYFYRDRNGSISHSLSGEQDRLDMSK